MWRVRTRISDSIGRGHHRNQVPVVVDLCHNVTQMQPENCWLSLHHVPDRCPNGILKFSKEKASDGIHPSKSAV
jgi:hypothetical protein